MTRLRLGERVRLIPGGTLYRVARVNSCAAYLRAINLVPKDVHLPNGRSFLAHEGGGLLPVSPQAFVYRELAT
jgi:hypothetical protein